MYSIVLSDLHDYDRPTTGHVFYHGCIFWEYTFVQFKELFSCRFVQVEHFQGWDLKTFTKDGVYDLASLSVMDSMGFDNAASAVIQESCTFPRSAKEERWFTFKSIWCITTMNSIAKGIFTESATDRVGRLILSHQGITGAHDLLENRDCVFSDKFKSKHHIWRDESCQILDERIVSLVWIKLLSFTTA